MKKILLFSLLVMSLFSAIVNASDIESYSGISYNSYSLKDFNQALDESYIKYEVEGQGIGYYFGFKKPIELKDTEEGLVGGLEVELLPVKWKTDDLIVKSYQFKSYGILGTLAYNIDKNYFTNLKFKIFTALGLYFNEMTRLDVDGHSVRAEGFNLGTKLGLEVTKKLMNNLKINAKIGFRRNNAKVGDVFGDVPIDLSGFESGVAIQWKF